VDEVDYVHLLFDDHELLFAEGAQSESLYLGTQTEKALSMVGRQEISAIFPEIARQVMRPQPARLIPPGHRQKKLVQRHAKNGKACLRHG
jgi:hypothetical protein